jgi:hypothetical protein
MEISFEWRRSFLTISRGMEMRGDGNFEKLQRVQILRFCLKFGLKLEPK